jgi:toxin ParE1/3/4
MTIDWTERALADLVALRAYIASDNPRAAERMVRRIVGLVEGQLSQMPESGRQGRVHDTRELVVASSPYMVVYRIVGDAIIVLRVLHGARRWPDTSGA